MSRSSSLYWVSEEQDRIEELLDEFPDRQRSALQALRTTLLQLLPGGVEVIAWGMPTVKVGHDQVVSYSGFAKHNSIFPGAEVAAIIAENYPDLVTTKGTIHLERDRPTPATLVRRIVKLRLEQINDSYPRANGTVRRYYPNGYTEYAGSIRDGEQHGSWEWFRRDGIIKRSGKFKAGVQIGEWTTYDTQGQPYKVTHKG